MVRFGFPVAVLAFVGVSACTFNTDGVPFVDGNTPPPDGPPTDSSSCTPGCKDDHTLVTCSGGTREEKTCDLACTATPEPHCLVLEASNGASAGDLTQVSNETAFTVPTLLTYEINTDNKGEILDVTDPGVALPVRPAVDGVAAGAYFRVVDDNIALLAVSSFTVEAGAKFTGIGKRALIILSKGNVLIRGTIDFSGGNCNADSVPGDDPLCGGPGGGNGGRGNSEVGGCAPGKFGVGSIVSGAAGDETGGGGGGFGSAGGNVGNGRAPDSVKGGEGGVPSMDCKNPALVPLRGGSGGGTAARGFVGGGSGGGGGGAIQITSLTRIEIDNELTSALATITVAGEGGRGATTDNDNGGGGGGAGGGILLEAPSIVVGARGVLAANGGGGGGGKGRTEPQTNNGEKGTNSTMPASGGPGRGDEDEGRGGDGASLLSVAGNGRGSVDGTGGGGGGGGIIRINGTAMILGNAVVSPEHTFGPSPVK